MTQPRFSTSEDPPIDEKVLADLIASIGNEDTDAQIEIFELFFESAPQLMAKVRSGTNSGAWEQVQADLHALKGSCELFGAAKLAQHCKELGKAITCGEVGQAPTQVAEIMVEFKRVASYLRDKHPSSAYPAVPGQEVGQPIDC